MKDTLLIDRYLFDFFGHDIKQFSIVVREFGIKTTHFESNYQCK